MPWMKRALGFSLALAKNVSNVAFPSMSSCSFPSSKPVSHWITWCNSSRVLPFFFTFARYRIDGGKRHRRYALVVSVGSLHGQQMVGDAGVEDYSHAGGFQCLRLERIFSTSCAKSASSTGALPVSSSWALARAMHSEIVRRTGSAACRTATGFSPSWITTSAPERTCFSNVATLVPAASFSERWITCFAISQLYTLEQAQRRWWATPRLDSSPPQK